MRPFRFEPFFTLIERPRHSYNLLSLKDNIDWCRCRRLILPKDARRCDLCRARFGVALGRRCPASFRSVKLACDGAVAVMRRAPSSFRLARVPPLAALSLRESGKTRKVRIHEAAQNDLRRQGEDPL